MKLLFETTNRTEVDNARFLLESNGIPVFIGNENAGTMLGPVFTARQFAIWVVLEQHYYDAEQLLENAEHEVSEPVDVQAFYADFEKQKPRALYKMLCWGTAILGLLLALLVLSFS